jgi:DNA-binding Lrp family transcriptional regulator
MNIQKGNTPQSTSERIIGYIDYNGQARAYDLEKTLKLSNVTIHKQLKKLIEQGMLDKIGKPPLVFYVLASKEQIATATRPASIVSANTVEYINANYLYVTPLGEMLHGLDGFREWVKSIKEEVRLVSLAEEYVQTHRKAELYRSSEGWIDATEKLRMTFSDKAIEKLYYADFYSIPKFGKTKLGQLVLYAKQSQNKELIDLVVKQVKPMIEKIIATYNIDTVIFIPASVPRRLQFMQEFARRLAIPLPSFQLVKSYKGDIIVPQKSLSQLEERITNARETIFTKSLLPINASNILLIDDAVGSGATLNETAKKLRPANRTEKKIFGFAIVGSIKGFEVIREI